MGNNKSSQKGGKQHAMPPTAPRNPGEAPPPREVSSTSGTRRRNQPNQEPMSSNALRDRIQKGRARKTRTAVTSKAPKTYTEYDRHWDNQGLRNFQKTQKQWLAQGGERRMDVDTTTDKWPFTFGDNRKQRKALLSVVDRKRRFPNPVPLGYVIDVLNASWNDP